MSTKNSVSNRENGTECFFDGLHGEMHTIIFFLPPLENSFEAFFSPSLQINLFRRIFFVPLKSDGRLSTERDSFFIRTRLAGRFNYLAKFLADVDADQWHALKYYNLSKNIHNDAILSLSFHKLI